MAVTSAVLVTSTVSAQISESTEDWPAWQKVSVGSLGAVSVLSTIALIGVSTNDGGDGSESNSDNADSDSGGNARKGQGYVEELKNELLLVVNLGRADSTRSVNDIDALARDYPVLASYYRELISEHPEVIDAVDEKIAGDTLVERLNRVMMVHLFGGETRAAPADR